MSARHRDNFDSIGWHCSFPAKCPGLACVLGVEQMDLSRKGRWHERSHKILVIDLCNICRCVLLTEYTSICLHSFFRIDIQKLFKRRDVLMFFSTSSKLTISTGTQVIEQQVL